MPRLHQFTIRKKWRLPLSSSTVSGLRIITSFRVFVFLSEGDLGDGSSSSSLAFSPAYLRKHLLPSPASPVSVWDKLLTDRQTSLLQENLSTRVKGRREQPGGPNRQTKKMNYLINSPRHSVKIWQIESFCHENRLRFITQRWSCRCWCQVFCCAR